MNYLMIILSLLITSTAATAAQHCEPTIAPDTPAGRFILNAIKGTALDKKTGLMWKRCAQGQTWDSAIKTCSGTVNTYDWKNALSGAESEVFAGFDDWRLPNKKELNSIIERKCYKPTINLIVFSSEAPGRTFWTATPSAAYSGSVWLADFFLGDESYGSTGSSYRYAVRLVRGRN